MALEFQAEVVTSRFLDPNRGFRETSESFELRTDPLTGRQTVVYDRGRYKLPKKDLEPLVARSLNIDCPFCPEHIEERTSRFIPALVPEGRLRFGEAWLVPNIRPYNPYSAVLVLSREHFVALDKFTPEMLVNGLRGARDYLARVYDYDAAAEHMFVGWNYMPPAGGSMVHPHLQPEACLYATPYQRELLTASAAYAGANGGGYWAELLAAERERGERYIGESGGICWLTPFVPRSRMMDVIALFPERASLLDVTDGEFAGFSDGLLRVFRYMHARNYYSFNLSFTSGRRGDGHFWTQARLVPRMTYLEMEISDCNYLDTLQDMHFSARRPEDVCREIKEYFKDGESDAAGN